MGGRSVRAIREYGWAVGDQVLSSGTNFAVAVVVARHAGPSEFGVFALAIAVWILVLNLGRSLLILPYTLRASPASSEEWPVETRLGAGASLVLGATAGAVLVGVGLAVGRDTALGSSLIIVGAFAAPLMVQEFWRIAAFSHRSARLAFANDAVWAATQMTLLLVFARVADLNSRYALAAWGFGALAGAVIGPLQFRLLPIVSRKTVVWGLDALHLGRWFGLDTIAFACGEQAALWMVAGIAGTAAVGGLRSVQTLFRPVGVLALAAESVTLPRAAIAEVNSGQRGVLRVAVRYSAILTLVIAVYALGAVVARGSLMNLVFGNAFAGFANLTVPIGLAAVLGGVAAGGSLGLRANRRGKGLAAAAAIAAGVKVLLVFVLTSVSGVLGGTWGFAAAAATQGIVLWFLLSRFPASLSVSGPGSVR